MTFDDHYQLALDELATSSIPPHKYAPPLHKALRNLGIAMRPPHYASLLFNTLITGIPFGMIWTGLMWYFAWQDSTHGGAIVFWAGVGAGALFGFFTALHYHLTARRANLSSWQQLLQKADTKRGA